MWGSDVKRYNFEWIASPQPQACNWEKETPLRPTQGTFLSRTIRIENEFLCFCLVSIEPVGGEELKLQNHGCCLYYVDQVTFLYSPNLLTPQLPLSSSVLCLLPLVPASCRELNGKWTLPSPPHCHSLPRRKLSPHVMDSINLHLEHLHPLKVSGELWIMASD